MKKYYFIIILAFLCVIPINVNAAEEYYTYSFPEYKFSLPIPADHLLLKASEGSLELILPEDASKEVIEEKKTLFESYKQIAENNPGILAAIQMRSFVSFTAEGLQGISCTIRPNKIDAESASQYGEEDYVKMSEGLKESIEGVGYTVDDMNIYSNSDGRCFLHIKMNIDMQGQSNWTEEYMTFSKDGSEDCFMCGGLEGSATETVEELQYAVDHLEYEK